MLDQQDKEWILAVLGKALKQHGQTERGWLNKKLDALRLELVQAMAEGFSECASAGQMERVEERLDRLEGRMGSIEKKFAWVEDNMVTKEYLDIRLGERKKKEILLHTGHTKKISLFVQKLYDKNILSGKEANVILALEPFPQKVREHE
ncbi:MAG: hypothetical protein AAB558_02055 [Patescibacteria group bacterium]